MDMDRYGRFVAHLMLEAVQESGISSVSPLGEMDGFGVDYHLLAMPSADCGSSWPAGCTAHALDVGVQSQSPPQVRGLRSTVGGRGAASPVPVWRSRLDKRHPRIRAVGAGWLVEP